MATSFAVLRIRPGSAYACRIDYEDEDGNAINITGETVTLTVTADGMTDLVLESGTGLTINYVLGQISVALTAAQTAALDGKRNRRFVLRLENLEVDILVGDIEEEPR